MNHPLKILAPDLCKSEITYVFNCFFKHFIPIEFELTFQKNIEHFVLETREGRLFISNHFFHSDNTKELFQKKNIPNLVDIKEVSIPNENNKYELVSLFGRSELSFKQTEIFLDSDIVASTFFMLSRWEENLTSEKDVHERFPLNASLAETFGFYERPIVNQYIELLSSLLNYLKLNVQSEHKYRALITYDIDSIQKWSKVKNLYEEIYSNLKSKRLLKCFLDIKSYLDVKLVGKKDPYNSFEFIIDSIQSHKLSGILYFKTDSTHEVYDKNLYRVNNQNVIVIINKLLSKGIKVGIHPSYHTFDNIKQLSKEIDLLKPFLGKDAKILSRQHYLKFSSPLTWRILNELNVSNDSTMLYPEKPGFRCGVCYSFPVYDCERRKELSLIETPLLFMDTPFLSKPDFILSKTKEITEIVKKYKGINVFLWHNSHLFNKKDKSTYLEILRIIEA